MKDVETQDATIVGVPSALFHVLAVGLCIASSIVVAEILWHAEEDAGRGS